MKINTLQIRNHYLDKPQIQKIKLAPETSAKPINDFNITTNNKSAAESINKGTIIDVRI